ncbi:MAG: TraX family protein [Pseudomonadota bacterium]
MKPYINPTLKELTSYDLLKLLAVITMIIDHVGHYFFPEVSEFRAIGRMSMPIWLFLVGFANTRELPPILWGGAFILLASYLVAGNPILPLNILFTIIVARAVLDTFAKIIFKNTESFLFGVTAMVFLAIPTSALFDYGTLALMWALFGYLCRYQTEMELSSKKLLGFLGVTTIVYLMYQQVFFMFESTSTLMMTISVSISAAVLYNFKAQALPDLTTKLPNLLNSFVKFCGRKTLYIYVVHLILFLAIGFFTQPERFGFFDLKFF